MSWAKLAGKNLSVPQETDNARSESASPTSARRESNTPSSSAMKGLLKKVTAGKQSSDLTSSASGNDGAWKALKRMSMPTEKSSERSSVSRMSEGALGLGIADLARNAIQQTQGQELMDKGIRKMSSAFKKLGKAHLMMA